MTYGLIGIGIVMLLTLIMCLCIEFFTKKMKEDSYDEYEAEQARLSWETRKEFGHKPNKLTQINAVDK